MMKIGVPDRGSAIRTLIVILIGGVLAWLLRDIWAPLLSGGIGFTERSLPVRLLLMTIFTSLFSLLVWGLVKANESITDTSIVKPQALLALIGGLTGALIFYLIYGPGTLDTGRIDWLFRLGDNTQHYLGWVFYRNDPWIFPIGFSCSLGYPTGTCMCFTDSIPLLAIPLKVVTFWLPETFQYFGWWTLLSFILQGMFAALILYEVTGKRLAAVISPLFFCTADILLFRVFRYTPLSGQWIILAAIYLYFLNRRDSQHNNLWPLVHIMAVLIQGYFFVMTFVVFCGTMLERYLQNHKLWPIVKSLAISLAATGLVMWIVGFFTASVDLSDAGLGYFKANLNAFFNPLVGWSRFFQPLPLAPDTYQMNVNYLGLGIILLFIPGAVMFFIHQKGSILKTLFTHSGLLVIILVLGVFALSNVITLNEHILFTYTLPEPLMKLWGVFRGTERMLWPTYYLIFIFTIGQAVQINRRGWVNGLILLAAFSVQLFEVAPRLQSFHAEFNLPQGKPTTLQSSFWEEAADQFDSLVILPLSLQNWDRLTQFAADYHLKINYSYFARESPSLKPAALEKMKALENGQTSPNEMYIIKSPDLFHALCGSYGNDDFFGYVNKEWVLAPGFEKNPTDYDDISITADIANCARLSLPDFVDRYQDDVLIFAVMDDASTLRTDSVLTPLRSIGLEIGLPEKPGMSYLAVTAQSRLIYETQSERVAEFRSRKAEVTNGITLPFALGLTSAGDNSGEENAVIMVNGRDYSYHQNGLNIVAVDAESGKVIDTALYTPVKP
jgi:hypothetical protein